MTTKEKKRYLEQYRRCELAQKQIEEEIGELRLSFLPSVNLDGMPHGTDIHDLSDYVARMDRLLSQLMKSMNRKAEMRLAIREAIERMQNETEKTVLILRYIQGMKWMDIADYIGYEERRTYQIHGLALQHFEPEEK